MSGQRVSRELRQLAVLWALVAAAVVALRPFWLALAPYLPPCPWRAATGLPCPTCGTTRSALALLHGDIFSALATNPLATVVAVGFLLGGPLALAWALTARPLPPLPRVPWVALRVAVVLAVAANWAWLMAHR